MNIILVGPSGVGKSTLINGIFNEKKSETGFGKVQTKNIQDYESNNIPFLRLIDSQGIEKKKKQMWMKLVKKLKILFH